MCYIIGDLMKTMISIMVVMIVSMFLVACHVEQTPAGTLRPAKAEIIQQHKEFCWNHEMQAGRFRSGVKFEDQKCYEDMGEDYIWYSVEHIQYAVANDLEFRTRFEARSNIAD